MKWIDLRFVGEEQKYKEFLNYFLKFSAIDSCVR